jgi:hypothetical protein
MSKSTFLKAFNTLFIDFMEDVKTIFPEDKNIKLAQSSFETIKKANPTIVIKTWFKYVTTKYGEEIEKGNLDYFVEKDYSEDLTKLSNSGDIIKSIDAVREPIKNMSETNKAHTLEYIQKLCKLSEAYISLA